MFGAELTHWLHTIPPEAVYGLILFIVSLESLGVPLPGELTVMTGALLASDGITNPFLVAIFAATGAIAGDSIGYYIGYHYGDKLLATLGRWFPRHFNSKTISLAERAFDRWGVWTVFFGRFIAFLRIFAGPIAGSLKMPYRRFLAANASGGITWAFAVTFFVYYVGIAAEQWLHRLSWIGLIAALVIGTAVMYVFTRRLESYINDKDEE